MFHNKRLFEVMDHSLSPEPGWRTGSGERLRISTGTTTGPGLPVNGLQK